MDIVLGCVFLGVALIAHMRVAHYRRDLRQSKRPVIELSREPLPKWMPDEPVSVAMQRMAAQFERVLLGRWQREPQSIGKPGVLAKHDLAFCLTVGALAMALWLLRAA